MVSWISRFFRQDFPIMSHSELPLYGYPTREPEVVTAPLAPMGAVVRVTCGIAARLATNTVSPIWMPYGSAAPGTRDTVSGQGRWNSPPSSDDAGGHGLAGARGSGGTLKARSGGSSFSTRTRAAPRWFHRRQGSASFG